MLRPLKKRFLFHFTGKRQTNRLDKPEWYLSQILTWAADHGEFCDRFVQAILIKAGIEGMQARLELMRGLVQIGIHKLQMDLPSLLADDHLLTHAIEEVLLFDRELRSQGYPPFYPCILNVLTADHCFIRWIALEKKYADEKRDVLLSSPTAWKPQYPLDGDADELKVPECAEAFMMILSAMTERYRHFEQPCHRLKFVSLQQILLEDWRLCLQQILTARLEELNLVAICPIVNAAHYVVQVLAQWSMQPFFIELLEACNEMQRKEKQRRQSIKQANSEAVDPEEALFLAASETPSDESGQLPPLAEYGTLQESVFEEVSQLLERLYTDTVLAIVDELVLDFKAKSKAYRREKWFCMPSLNDREDAGLTPTAFPMLSWLQSNLQHLQEALAAPLFSTLWQEAARGISVFLYEELILENFFSEGGAMQLSFDMNRNLFPLFSTYTQKPENHFKEVKEACILLTMPHPVAWILQETLRAARATDVVTGGTALEEQGVSFLTPSQAMHVLSKRNDLVHT
uniref:Putative er to golgi transport protein/rad50-interacting protein 1 n=1 Tax=Amblyomma sculptum TaxID=1581419 RepID=A0A1E1XLS0_AMBSC